MSEIIDFFSQIKLCTNLCNYKIARLLVVREYSKILTGYCSYSNVCLIFSTLLFVNCCMK